MPVSCPCFRSIKQDCKDASLIYTEFRVCCNTAIWPHSFLQFTKSSASFRYSSRYFNIKITIYTECASKIEKTIHDSKYITIHHDVGLQHKLYRTGGVYMTWSFSGWWLDRMQIKVCSWEDISIINCISSSVWATRFASSANRSSRRARDWEVVVVVLKLRSLKTLPEVLKRMYIYMKASLQST